MHPRELYVYTGRRMKLLLRSLSLFIRSWAGARMMNDDVSQSTKLFGLTDWRSLSMSPMTERTRESSKKRKEKSRSWSKNFFVFVLLIFWSGKQQMCRSRRDSRAQMDRWPWRCVHFRPAVFFFLPIQQENWEK